MGFEAPDEVSPRPENNGGPEQFKHLIEKKW